MKIGINEISLTPSKYGFNFCQYGILPDTTLAWANYWGFDIVGSGGYTNMMVYEGCDITKIFKEPLLYSAMDGFSPNLNKHLHVGHFSNFVIAKSFQKLGLAKETFAILGDTLDGDVKKGEAKAKYKEYCKLFDYTVDGTFHASQQELPEGYPFIDGEGTYEGTKCFDVNGQKIVGIKADGSTSYFYQDVALAEGLNRSTLYLTGFEQKEHFESLKILYPHIDHIGLGLVFLDGKKMSSSEGNVIYLADMIDQMLPLFNNDLSLVYNILAGQILKSTPSGKKTINTKILSNPKLSLGLYLSYTMAHIKSCGIDADFIIDNVDKFQSKELAFAEIKSKVNLNPAILFNEVVKHAKKMNNLYTTHMIKGNPENIELFSNLMYDLQLGMYKLGMHQIDKV